MSSSSSTLRLKSLFDIVSSASSESEWDEVPNKERSGLMPTADLVNCIILNAYTTTQHIKISKIKSKIHCAANKLKSSLQTMLGVFSVYKNQFFELPGVESDMKNLLKLVTKYKITFEFISDSQVTADNLKIKISAGNFKILWMCGHGMLDSWGQNIYLLPSPTVCLLPCLWSRNFFSSNDLKQLIQQNTQQVLIFVFDFCHSGSMLNMKYKYFGGSFIESPSSTDICGPDKIRISISGSDDSEQAPETREGGFLTRYLTWLLLKYKFLSLWLIDGERSRTENSFIIKVNTKINDRYPFIKLI